ncbi:MAG: class I SAM-dependent methyltransferase [Candidatus Woesearchaeota archaeon]|jgi:predicted O-methyltransferase YrrM
MTSKQKHRFYLQSFSKEIYDKCVVNKHDSGIFIECGVKYGSSAIIIAKELNLPGYLFDTWNKFDGITSIDGNDKRIKRIKKRKLKYIYLLCKKAIKENNLENLCTMIKGDVRKTLPLCLKDMTKSIMFAHLDMDLYSPTKMALELIWPKLHENGLVFVHDYNDKKWKGITKSVDDFVTENKNITIKELDIHACVLRKV